MSLPHVWSDDTLPKTVNFAYIVSDRDLLRIIFTTISTECKFFVWLSSAIALGVPYYDKKKFACIFFIKQNKILGMHVMYVFFSIELGNKFLCRCQVGGKMVFLCKWIFLGNASDDNIKPPWELVFRIVDIFYTSFPNENSVSTQNTHARHFYRMHFLKMQLHPKLITSFK